MVPFYRLGKGFSIPQGPEIVQICNIMTFFKKTSPEYVAIFNSSAKLDKKFRFILKQSRHMVNCTKQNAA